MNSETRNCQNCKSKFLIEPEDFLFYEKIKVPPPTWCPECRLIRRLMFRSERNLYRVKDSSSGKEIFSGIPREAGLTIYDHDYWWSDAWDPGQYGRGYDFSRPFFEQLREFTARVPWPSRAIQELINSDYSDKASYLKNCYLCFNLGHSEDSAYVMSSWNVRNSFDLIQGENAELCYESMEIEASYKTFFSLYCDETREVWFSRDLSGCSNCVGCVNLRNKQYYIFNKPYGKEAYFEELAKMRLDTFSGLERTGEKAREFWRSRPYKFMHGVQNVNVSGDCIHNAKNVAYSFEVEDIEDSKFCRDVSLGVKDSYDYTVWGENAELMYESLECGFNSKGVKFSHFCWPADQDVEYSVNCGSSSNLFACAGLRKKSYCIFNRQYTPEEYYTLREKIIRHMEDMPYRDLLGRTYSYGEFLPPEFSPYAYNETIAQDYFPLTKKEAEEKGYLWREPEIREYKTTIRSQNLADHIGEVSDSVVDEIIECARCTKPYRIISQELNFLRVCGIPAPRICWQCRFTRRLRLGNIPRFYTSKCQCAGETSENDIYSNEASHFHGSEFCPNEFVTSFSPEREEIIYCEQCYNGEVV